MFSWLMALGLVAGAENLSGSACAAIDADSQRLACYDALFRGSPTAPDGTAPGPHDITESAAAKAAVVAAPGAAVATAAPATAVTAALPTPVIKTPPNPAEEFGLTAEQKQAKPPAPERKIDSVALKIASVKRQAQDRYVIALENGQIWSQTEPTARQRFYPGDTIVIRKAALGSYLASGPNSGGVFRVRRER